MSEPAAEANSDTVNFGEESDDEGSSSEDGSSSEGGSASDGWTDEPPYHCDFSMFDQIEPLWTKKVDTTIGSTFEVTDSAIISAGAHYVDGVYTDEGYIERRTLDGGLEWLETVPGLVHWSSADTDHLYYWSENTHTVLRRSLQNGALDQEWATEGLELNRINAVGEHVVISRGQEFVWYEKLTGEPVGSLQWDAPGETVAYGNIIAPMPSDGYVVGVRTGEYAVHRLLGLDGFWLDTTLDIEGYQPAIAFILPRPEGIWIGTTAGLDGTGSESMVMLLSNDGREQMRTPIQPCGSLAGVELSASFAQTDDGLLGVARLTTYSEESIHFVENQDLVVRLDWSGELTAAHRIAVPPRAAGGRVMHLRQHEGVTVVAFTDGGWAEDQEFYLAQLAL